MLPSGTGAAMAVRRLVGLALALALLGAGTPRPALAAPTVAVQAASLLTGLDGTEAMVAEQPGQAPLVSINADAPMESASLYKLGVLAAAYTVLDRGAIALDQTVTITQEELDFYGDDPATPAGVTLSVAEALRRMITRSDNSAAGALLGLLGYRAVNAAFAANGMPHSHMGSPPGAPASDRSLAQTTAGDQAAFFSRLLAGKVVSPAASEAMIELLKAQEENDRLPALLPDGTIVAHKTGELDDVRNDAGIIFTARGPLVCAVLTNGQSDIDGAIHAIAQEGLLAYNAVMAAGPPLPDYSLGDGWFFSQANGSGGDGGSGYTVSDAGGVGFWSAFQARGGVPAVGYPASRRFDLRGFTYQVMQKEVFQWRPEAGTIAFMNVFDALHDAGLDSWLNSSQQIPPPFDTTPDSGLPFARVIARHQQLLSRAPAIRARYFADPDGLDDYGLPMSVKDYGPVIVVRCQRAAFQYWKVAMPFARAGTVTLVNGGDVAKAAGLFPRAAVTPGTPGTS